MGNIKSKRNFKPVELSPYRLEESDSDEKSNVFIDQDYSDIVKDKQVLVTEAKEFFHKGNDNFRACNYDQAKYCYMEALEKLQLCDSSVKSHSYDEMIQGSEGIINYAVNRYFKAKYLLDRTNELLKTKCNSLITASETLRKEIIAKNVSMKEKVLAVQLKEHGTLDSMFSDLMNNLAACYELSGDLDNAKKLYEDSMRLRKISYGPHSLKAAESMQNLATIYDSMGQLSHAEQLLTQALNIERSELGEENIQVTVSMNNLGLLKAHMGEYDMSIKLLSDTVNIRKRHFGEDHHLTKCAILNLEFTMKQKAKSFSHSRSWDSNDYHSPLLRNNGLDILRLQPTNKSYLEGDFTHRLNSFSEGKIGGPDWHRFSQDTDIEEGLDSESHGSEDYSRNFVGSIKKKDIQIKSFKPFEGKGQFDEIIKMDPSLNNT